MPKRKDPNYETRATLHERCVRQSRTIRRLQTQLDLAKRANARIADIARLVTHELSKPAWSGNEKQGKEQTNEKERSEEKGGQTGRQG